MIWKREWRWLAAMAGGVLVAFYLPIGSSRFDHALLEGFHLVKWYAREHVLLCLVPAFFIAGAISVFVSQASVMKYLGADAPKALAYAVASVSGTALAVCSCTVLPLFAGIYRLGAGLGPATAFLYSGPAINVLAIVLTARVLGIELGVARAAGAIVFSVAIGLLMHAIFRDDERARAARAAAMPSPPAARPLAQEGVYFASLIGILVFANWARPVMAGGLWQLVYDARWAMTAAWAAVLAIALVAWFGLSWRRVAVAAVPTLAVALLVPDSSVAAFAVAVAGLSAVTSTAEGDAGEWFAATWAFAKQILPLLLAGVLIAGVLLGRPGQEGLIPSAWVRGLVGGNSPGANFFAAVVGAFMYFATLTEVPIVQGLLGAGMGKGPALTLLLAGPALSLPSMLVLRGILGTRKTVVYVVLVVVMATATGLIYGSFSGA
jgi:uncharacterized membrane protein YraQ (UPF0718 family)